MKKYKTEFTTCIADIEQNSKLDKDWVYQALGYENAKVANMKVMFNDNSSMNIIFRIKGKNLFLTDSNDDDIKYIVNKMNKTELELDEASRAVTLVDDNVIELWDCCYIGVDVEFKKSNKDNIRCFELEDVLGSVQECSEFDVKEAIELTIKQVFPTEGFPVKLRIGELKIGDETQDVHLYIPDNSGGFIAQSEIHFPAMRLHAGDGLKILENKNKDNLNTNSSSEINMKMEFTPTIPHFNDLKNALDKEKLFIDAINKSTDKQKETSIEKLFIMRRDMITQLEGCKDFLPTIEELMAEHKNSKCDFSTT